MPNLTRGLSVTRRALMLLAVFAILVLMYASSLKIYFQQQHDIATRQADIRDANARIYDLQDKIARWQDPNFVKAQARDRLGWLVPGETGYVVIGPDGKPIQGSSQLTQDRGLNADGNLNWWQKLWDSIVTADRPTNTDKLKSSPPPSSSPSGPISEAPSPTPTTR